MATSVNEPAPLTSNGDSPTTISPVNITARMAASTELRPWSDQ